MQLHCIKMKYKHISITDWACQQIIQVEYVFFYVCIYVFMYVCIHECIHTRLFTNYVLYKINNANANIGACWLNIRTSWLQYLWSSFLIIFLQASSDITNDTPEGWIHTIMPFEKSILLTCSIWYIEYF